MKKVFKIVILCLMVLGIKNVSAATNIPGLNVNFNYGGTKDDKLWDIDFFSDGSYVVVGESRSSFNTIVHEDENGQNDTTESDALIAIFDKDSNLVKEYSWTTKGNLFEEFYDVTVMDDNHFMVCGKKTYDGFCTKYDKNFQEIWTTNLVGSAAQSESEFNSIKTSDGNYLISIGDPRLFVLSDAGTIVKENIYMKTGANVYSNLWPSALFEYNNEYYVGGSEGVLNGMFSKYDKDFNLIFEKKFENYHKIYDIDVVNNSILLSVDDANDGKLVVLDSDYNVSKEIDLNKTSSDIDTKVLSNGNIVVTLCGSSDSTIYYFDSNLNKIMQTSFLDDLNSNFKLVNSAVNPTNQIVYAVGHSNISLGNIKNNGGNDGIVVSYDFSKSGSSNGSGSSNSSGSDTNDNTSSAVSSSNDSSKNSNESVDNNKEQNNSGIENPPTGKYVPYVLLIVALLSGIVIYIYARKKSKIFNV